MTQVDLDNDHVDLGHCAALPGLPSKRKSKLLAKLGKHADLAHCRTPGEGCFDREAEDCLIPRRKGLKEVSDDLTRPRCLLVFVLLTVSSSINMRFSSEISVFMNWLLLVTRV